MRQLIASGAREKKIPTLAGSRGCGDLLDSGIRRMLEGLTAPEEILRVTFSEAAAEEQPPAQRPRQWRQQCSRRCFLLWARLRSRTAIQSAVKTAVTNPASDRNTIESPQLGR